MASLIISTIFAGTLTSVISPVSATTYNVIKSLVGSNFFDGFTFFGGYDNTSEFLYYVQALACQKNHPTVFSHDIAPP